MARYVLRETSLRRGRRVVSRWSHRQLNMLQKWAIKRAQSRERLDIIRPRRKPGRCKVGYRFSRWSSRAHITKSWFRGHETSTGSLAQASKPLRRRWRVTYWLLRSYCWAGRSAENLTHHDQDHHMQVGTHQQIGTQPRNSKVREVAKLSQPNGVEEKRAPRWGKYLWGSLAISHLSSSTTSLHYKTSKIYKFK